MNRSQTIWTRRTPNFRVTLSWEYENDPDLSWDESGEVTEKLNSGEYVNCCFRVAVHDDTGSELAAEYLGNSIYANPAEFVDHRECGRENRRLAATGAAGRCGSYFRDMLANACHEARREVNRQRPRLRNVDA